MKFLKGCCSFVFVILLSLFLFVFLIILTVQENILKPDSLHQVVDELEIIEISSEFAKEAIESEIQENEDSTKEDNFEPNEYIDEVTNSLGDEDEKIIKERIHDNIDIFFEFLGSTEKVGVTFNLEGLRKIVVKGIINSPKIMEQANLPFDLCERKDSASCIDKDKFATFLDKTLTNELNEQIILDTFPKCSSGITQEQANNQELNCITQAQIKELLANESGELLPYEESSDGPEEGALEGIPDKYTVDYEELAEVQDLREVINSLDYLCIILFILCVILSIVFILFYKSKATNWIGACLIISSLLSFIFIVSGFIIKNALKNEFENQVEYASIKDEGLNVIDIYVDNLLIYLLKLTIIVVVGAIVIITLGIFDRKRKSRGNKTN